MGPPINHSAFPIPARFKAEGSPKRAFIFLAIDDQPLQEVNNNSGWKTSGF
jgi:hypothetical protein